MLNYKFIFQNQLIFLKQFHNHYILHQNNLQLWDFHLFNLNHYHLYYYDYYY